MSSFILPTLVHFICYHLLKIVWYTIGICMILTPLWPLSYEITIASIAWDHCVLDPMRPPCPQSYETTVSSILWGHHALDRMGPLSSILWGHHALDRMEPLCPRSYETPMPSIVWNHCVLDPMRPPCPRSDESWSYIYHHQRLRMFDASSLWGVLDRNYHVCMLLSETQF